MLLRFFHENIPAGHGLAATAMETSWLFSTGMTLCLPLAARLYGAASVSDALAWRERGQTCENAERDRSMVSVSWVRNLHQSHDPVPGPFSICVHRKDAATVSYTEVRCSGEGLSMSYRSGSPCLSDRFDSETSLAFGATSNRNPVNEACAQTSI